MSKRSISVGILTAGLTVGLAASAMGPALAQGDPVGGKGNMYFLSGAVNSTGNAQDILIFGDAGDEVFYGDWYGTGVDLPMVHRGNVFFVPDQYTPSRTAQVFAYGDAGDQVLVGDWDGDLVDSIAIKRGNHYFVKNDNLKSGKADSDFYYGDAGDKVMVGNWNGIVQLNATAGVDNNGDGDFVDPATPAYASDLNPVGIDNNGDGDTTDIGDVDRDPGFDANSNGNYTDPGDRQPGTGVDNNKDGDFNDPAKAATIADIPPGDGGKGDTIMVRRGNQFFVKNTISTGVADYSFYYGDPTDTFVVGDWATPAKAATASASAMLPVSGDGADQLAVRRGLSYFQSSELAAAAAKKANPTTTREFAYGDAGDTVFVSSLPSPAVDEFGKALYQLTLNAAVTAQDAANELPALTTGNYYYNAAGAPLVVDKTAVQNTTGSTVSTYKNRAGVVVPVANNAYYTVNGLIGGDPLYDGTTGVIKVVNPAVATASVTGTVLVFTKSGAPATTNTKLNNTVLVVTGDGLGVRR